jgi:acetylornithine deacetylase/succinyl-diaminopimelate desuccinylase-like protein
MTLCTCIFHADQMPTRYLYGRGVSDNKGPILVVACAAATLKQKRELEVDLVMLIEGEEEAGSRGFASTVRKHKVRYCLTSSPQSIDSSRQSVLDFNSRQTSS